MTVDSDEDLEKLRRIGRIVGLAVREMKKHLRPGVTTGELDEIAARFLAQHGARSAPMLVYQFPGHTCISVNDVAAHGIPGEQVIQPGDLVNLDVSAELDGYFADTGASFPVPPVSPQVELLCRCAQKALQNAIAAARAGALISAIGRAVETEANRCGFTILRDLNGHGVGRSIHEDPRAVRNYFHPNEKRRLEAGTVLTIEPFLATGADHTVAGRDGWTLRTSDGSLAAQYEHTLVIRRGHPLVITAV